MLTVFSIDENKPAYLIRNNYYLSFGTPKGGR
jgi:hypothetical protein